LFSRKRRVVEGPLADVPTRFRSTTNPGGIGHEWVYKRFIARWEKWKKGEAKRPKRNFWPALLGDNPKLDREDYAASMMELDPVTRAQLLRGDWNIRPDGRMFRSRWFQRIHRADLPGNARWCRFWDMASTDPTVGRDPDYTVGGLMGRGPDGKIYIADIRRWRKDPGDNDELMRAVGRLDTRRVKQLVEQEPGSSGKTAVFHYRTTVFRESDFQAVPASGKARGRTTTLVGRKTPPAKIMAAGPFASMASAGMVYVVVDGSWDYEAFIDEMEIFPDGEHDDQADAIAGGYNWLAKYGTEAPMVGGINAEFIKDNEWRPEAMPVHMPTEEWEGQRIGEQRYVEEKLSGERIAADIERATASRYAV
jgi:predicted phage terminase large subunit-like protein